MTDGWQPGVIMVSAPDGKTPLPGWVSHPFGLDWAIDYSTGKAVWIVHHLPTGFNLMAVDHEIGDVVQLVDLLRSLGDWSFSDVARVHEFADTLAIVRASGFTVFSPTLRCGRPTMPNQLGELAA
ncbi:hypothetical protein [Sphingobium sp.]|uniref:hypothetical protein n=1 Tax=Sphingobium sp. TaxID=1912891 RepID=UPI003BB65E10